MNIEVNYKNKKRYTTAKYPKHQYFLWTALIQILSKIMLIGKKYKIEKVNMEGLKPPYMLLCNHMHFIDFELCSLGTFPHRVSNVVSIDGYYRRPWLMELIGCICTRKFTMDLHLIKSINKVLKRGDVLCMYPEARYTPAGITSYLPESLGKLIRMNKAPVVVCIFKGNALHSPFWDFRKKRKVPMHATFTQILTAEQVQSMTADEINEAVRKAFEYDEYQYQKDNVILITEPYRAEGLHKILYQCPHCMTESKMDSKGTELFCTHCGKRWHFNEDGTLSAIEGETEFSRVPDWFRWEREQVRQQVRSGEYRFEDEVDVFGFPRCWKFIPLGKAKFTHDPENGFVIEGHYNGAPYRMHRLPQQTNSVHVEYDYAYLNGRDAIDISSETDSLYCCPSKKDSLTKLAFAVEEIYALKSAKKEKVNV